MEVCLGNCGVSVKCCSVLKHLHFIPNYMAEVKLMQIFHSRFMYALAEQRYLSTIIGLGDRCLVRDPFSHPMCARASTVKLVKKKHPPIKLDVRFHMNVRLCCNYCTLYKLISFMTACRCVGTLQNTENIRSLDRFRPVQVPCYDCYIYLCCNPHISSSVVAYTVRTVNGY